MTIALNTIAPDFEADTTQGRIRFHEWMGDGWAILFSHPKDFTPVCATELGSMARITHEFAARNCKVLGISADSLERHQSWMADIAKVGGKEPDYPLIADPELRVAKLYGMLPASAEPGEDRTPADNATVRAVFIIGPDKAVKLVLSYPMSTGRNFAEILRVLDSMQLTAYHKVATPADWKQGDKVIILPSLSDEAAKEAFPAGWDAVTPYMRVVDQPN
ncbi:MAG: peroxiredoxin [Pseudomonadota bacterium]